MMEGRKIYQDSGQGGRRGREGGWRIGGRSGRKGNRGRKEANRRKAKEWLDIQGSSRSQARQQAIAATAMEARRKEEEWARRDWRRHTTNRQNGDGNLHLELMGGE
jgi:hypothetical protein